MSVSESLLPEFDHEVANTRKTIERIPDDKLAWKPHEKSYTMGALVTHLATIPSWAQPTMEQDALDLAPPGAPPYQVDPVKSRQEALERFDQNVAAARAAISGASDDLFFKPWTLLAGGQTIFTMSKMAVLRGFIMNHMIHHRAQLGIYLRLNDVPVPSIYGPSADENLF
jgi:uncharacterized damage-inducible protein DinB